MAEVQLVAICLAIAAFQTMTADPSFSFCPNLCTCNNKEIICPMESLPVKLPPDSFNYMSIKYSKNRATVIPARAFQLSGENERLTIRIWNANISKISAHAFEGLKVIKSLHLNSCHINKLEKYSISNINVTNEIFVMNTSIGTIDQLAFHQVNSKRFYIFKSNITRFSRASFNRVQIKEFRLYKSNLKHIESNAFGLWAAGIDSFKLKYSGLGSFECNEASNGTAVIVSSLVVNCSCSAVWILKKTSRFYPNRSEFQCLEKPDISLLEMEDNLLMSCSNRTEAMGQSCSPRQELAPAVHGIRPLRSDSTRHLISMSLFLFNWLFRLEINAFIR